MLAARGVDPPKLHDLDRLAARLSEADNASFDGIDLPEFTRWAIEGRYPDDLDDAGRADAVLAIALALHRRSSGRTAHLISAMAALAQRRDGATLLT